MLGIESNLSKTTLDNFSYEVYARIIKNTDAQKIKHHKKNAMRFLKNFLKDHNG